MTDSEKTEALVRYRLEQADEALAAAGLESHQWTPAVRRQPRDYAMFYAVPALLAARQLETSRHSGAISQFDQLYIKPALLPRNFSHWLHDAFLNRQAADYGSELTLSQQDIESLVAHARDFLAGVRQHLGTSGASGT